MRSKANPHTPNWVFPGCMHPMSCKGLLMRCLAAAERFQNTPYVLTVDEKLGRTGMNVNISCHPPGSPGEPDDPGATAPEDWNLANAPGPSEPVPYNADVSQILIADAAVPPRDVKFPPEPVFA